MLPQTRPGVSFKSCPTEIKYRHRLGANQGRGPDSSFQNKPKHWDSRTCAILLGKWEYRRQSHFPVRICLFGYTWAVLLGRICLHPGLVCISLYPGSNQVAFLGL